MPHCQNCGGRLRRIHRTFTQKFSCLAVYECRQCRVVRPVPRQYTYYSGPHPRCPKCGTLRLRCLSEPDRIDAFHGGLVSALLKLARAHLYHCRYCRLQFYDWRSPVAPEANVINPPPPEEGAISDQRSAVS